MGCCRGKPVSPEQASEEPTKEMGDFLSAAEMDIVRDNWKYVQRDLIGTGVSLFTRLFEQQGGFKKMFRRMMTQPESGQYDVDWSKLEHHAGLVMRTLDEVITYYLLQPPQLPQSPQPPQSPQSQPPQSPQPPQCPQPLRDPKGLSTKLEQLGRTHHSHSIQPDMLPLMWPALRDALKETLQLDFSLEAELAWKHVFDFVVSHLQQGIRLARDSPQRDDIPHKS